MNKYFKAITLLFAINPLTTFGQQDTIQDKATNTIKPIGYLRTAIAESKGGGTMADFKAPGALSHYRLGNEANTYGEFGVSYNHGFENSDKSFDVVLMFSGYSGFGDNESFKLNNVAQFYVKMNKVIAGADLWAGKRYYFRHDYHMADFFWYNPGQDATVGFGIENLRSENHKDRLAFSVFNYDNKDVSPSYELAEEEHVASKVLSTYSLEGKWSDIPVNKDGKLMVWGRIAKRRANEDLGYQSAKGFGVGIAHDQSNLFNGKGSNNLQINFKKGVSVTQNQYTGLPVFETFGNPNVISYDMNKNYAFEVSDMFFLEDEKNYAINAMAIYRAENRGMTPYQISNGEKLDVGQKIHWLSGGFRFMKYLSKHFNLALEYGVDYVDNQTINKKGALQKVTFSPQIAWDYGYYTRPVFRPFVTYAGWSKELKGEVGGGLAPFGDKTNGLTYGIAFEIWF